MAPRERRDLLDATEESFDELIATNLKGPHFLTQQAARWMTRAQRRGGSYSSPRFPSYTASVNRGEYCISKAALSMTVALYAQRLAELGIKVFEIRPGHHSHRHDRQSGKGLRRENRRRACCRSAAWAKAATSRRRCAPIADGMLDYSTGQILNVDGGFSLRSL